MIALQRRAPRAVYRVYGRDEVPALDFEESKSARRARHRVPVLAAALTVTAASALGFVVRLQFGARAIPRRERSLSRRTAADGDAVGAARRAAAPASVDRRFAARRVSPVDRHDARRELRRARAGTPRPVSAWPVVVPRAATSEFGFER